MLKLFAKVLKEICPDLTKEEINSREYTEDPVKVVVMVKKGLIQDVRCSDSGAEIHVIDYDGEEYPDGYSHEIHIAGRKHNFKQEKKDVM